MDYAALEQREKMKDLQKELDQLKLEDSSKMIEDLNTQLKSA